MGSTSSPDRAALPVLWSFRRCPYAMRARLAIASSGQTVALREVVLRDKPPAFLAASPSATVPCLETDAGAIDESLDIMLWALGQGDPQGWLDMPEAGRGLIDTCDGPFKQALDLYKYASRHPDSEPIAHRTQATEFLRDLDARLGASDYLLGDRATLADMAILPFVRQFAHTDLDWFAAQPWPDLLSWLNQFKASGPFGAIMHKYPQWRDGDALATFP